MVSPILLIAVPLALAFITPLLAFVSRKLAGYVPVVAMAFNLALAAHLLPEAIAKPIIVRTAGLAPPFSIHLVAGPLGIVLSMLIALVGLLVAIYALGYIQQGPVVKYHTLYLLLLTAATGIVLTGDLFNLFVFFEILCISSYALVGYHGDRASTEAAAKYIIQGAIGSSLILVGIGFIYGLFGTLSMADIARNITTVSPMNVFISMAFLITGFGVEGAIFPLNAWLPDAHSSAPSSISAILSGIAIKMGIYAIARVLFTIYGAESIMLFVAVLGLLTLLIGEASAFSQTNIKRLLAYSSIGQVGLIVFAFGMASVIGIEAALFLIISHALAKAILFMSTGYMTKRTGSIEISALEGIGRSMPLSALFFTIGAFSLVGLPPFVGFPSKFMVIRAALENTDMVFSILIGVALLGTLVEGAYFFRIVQALFFKEPAANPASTESAEIDDSKRHRAPISALIPLGILAVLIIVLGIWPQIVSDILRPAATELLNRAEYIRSVLG